MAWAQLIIMHNDGPLLNFIEETQKKSRQHSSYIARKVGPRPVGTVSDRFRDAVSEVTETAIARMIPIGPMMRQGLGD